MTVLDTFDSVSDGRRSWDKVDYVYVGRYYDTDDRVYSLVPKVRVTVFFVKPVAEGSLITPVGGSLQSRGGRVVQGL